MNKRAFYFWLERLKISPAERKAVSLLMVLLVTLTLTNGLMKQQAPYDEEYYMELEQAFKRRAALVKNKEDKLLARYDPEIRKPVVGSAVRDTIPADTIETGAPPESVKKGSPVREKKFERIDVNTATIELLQSLPGIGPVYARRIVEYREENGNFASTEDLINVKGIGKKRLKKLKPFIKLKGSTQN